MQTDYFIYKTPHCLPRFKYFHLFIFTLFFISLFAAPAEAVGRGRIQDLLVQTIKKEIFVSAKLEGGFRGEIIKDIHNGIPKEFYYYLVLKRKEKRWFDEEILSKTIRYTVQYDTLKKVYAVTTSIEETSLETQLSDFKAMKEMVTQVKRIRLASTTRLNSGKHYFVSVQSQMQAAKPPFYLDYFLFFIPLLEIDTPWVDSSPISFADKK